MSGDLVQLYTDDDGATVRLVGGPHDGRTLTWSNGAPPLRIEMSVDSGPPSLVDLTEPITPSFRKAAYDAALDELGFPSRADDGALLYECTVQ